MSLIFGWGAAALGVAVLAAACSSSPSSSTSGSSGPGGAGTLRVVAIEDAWGSIARQVGGDLVEVTSLLGDPAADPHDYEPTPQDAAALARADLVVVNGLGYDSWATKALAASPNDRRVVLDVGAVLGLHDGDNPHQWYSPIAVDKVVDELGADLGRLDGAHAAAFTRQANDYKTTGLATYRQLIADIAKTYGGTPVGASESIFVPLNDALGLDLRTPPAFLDAVSAGVDPTARDKTTVDEQITTKQIAVFVYNAQNATPDVTALREEAAAAGIPTPSVTESLSPAGVTFQDWQVRQLQELRDALAKGTGR